jgi:putative two-component system response regulator
MKTILIVEDDETVRELLARKFADDRTRVVSAPDGAKALEVAERESPDLILMDVCMPRMNGYDACKALRENRLTRGIPVILCTSLVEIADQLHGLKCGADDYVVKPLDLDWLASKVERLLLRPRPVLTPRA